MWVRNYTKLHPSPLLTFRIMETSRTLIDRCQNPESGPLPYASWTTTMQKTIITKCGIAASHHKGKRKQKEMLRHLSESDLPLDAGEVLRQLKLQNICYAGANSRQKMAYVLLREISGAGQSKPNPSSLKATPTQPQP